MSEDTMADGAVGISPTHFDKELPSVRRRYKLRRLTLLPRDCKHRKLSMYSPRWEGAVERMCFNFIKQNYWRVDPMYEKNDLLQECAIKFCQVRNKYPAVVEHKHFMALLYQALIRHFHTMSNSATRDRGMISTTSIHGLDGTDSEDRDGLDYMTLMYEPPSDYHAADWRMDLSVVPHPIAVIVKDAPQMPQRTRFLWCNGRYKETTEMYLRRLTGSPVPYWVSLRTILSRWLGVSRSAVQP